MKKSVAVLAAVGIAGASLMSAPAAQAQTVKACVKKSNGSVKIINKKFKKCKKGWVKTSWNSESAQGPQGTPGPSWLVKDKNGVTLGTFSGYTHAGLLPVLNLSTDDGGVFEYDMAGRLTNHNTVLYFVNNGCTDAAVFSPTNTFQAVLQSAGGAGRLVFQVTGAPTASAWRVAATTVSTVPVAGNSLFQKNGDTGACAAASHLGGFIVPLTPAQAPVVAAPGPLQVVR